MSRSALLSALVAAFAWAAGFDSSGWQWRKTFASSKMPQAWVRLDPEVYGGAREDLADLRVLDPKGTETPYVLDVEKDDIRDLSRKARLYNLSRTPDFDTRFELDLGSHPQPHNYLFLDIDPESRDFRVMVRLEGSDDAQRWSLLKDRASILDFSESFRLRYTEIYYPESDFRYLRVTLRDHDTDALKVRGAFVRRHAHLEGREEERAFTASRSTTAASLVWELDFGHEHVPVRRLAFSVAPGEFKRRMAVSVPSDIGTGWREVGSGAIYRYRTARFSGELLETAFPEQRTRRLRVEVFHYNDKPTPVTRIKAFGYIRRLRLKEPEAGTYAMYYGNPRADEPRYDLAELAAYLPDKDVPTLRVSPQEANPGYRPARKPWTEEHPGLLPLALSGAAVLLGVLVARQWRRTGP